MFFVFSFNYKIIHGYILSIKDEHKIIFGMLIIKRQRWFDD